jgi:hypothetical protein
MWVSESRNAACLGSAARGDPGSAICTLTAGCRGPHSDANACLALVTGRDSAADAARTAGRRYPHAKRRAAGAAEGAGAKTHRKGRSWLGPACTRGRPSLAARAPSDGGLREGPWRVLRACGVWRGRALVCGGVMWLKRTTVTGHHVCARSRGPALARELGRETLTVHGRRARTLRAGKMQSEDNTHLRISSNRDGKPCGTQRGARQ